ncbi:nucleotidyltransferase domain-containing protein [Hydrogenimonas thermophila]|uniref:type VII toxin-antitoxin system MntA family adenylyltransferase antitoxin n=1 Tax=Hydrogenimonas thermophila TaxID=223786 RepID=UPI0029373B61|nr:nucleotidyltransferase domain-containing protein [Hydrogenimonas thermophila]WOE68799.1 nucleotidyltransferase domain-containing protein [Hydrogenimonas thermophila]WOE71309.1 nucleotidyltransferase domain-containing protein [Hydrogenimonas thermophila]
MIDIEVNKITDILEEYDFIINALIFGSYSNGKAGRFSDVDIAIEVAETIDLLTMGEIISRLEVEVKRKIDLVIINELHKKSPLLAFNIYKNHKILFIKDQKRYDNFKESALHFYLDFKRVLDEQNRMFLKRVESGNIGKIKTA